jgi:hypothetical protein
VAETPPSSFRFTDTDFARMEKLRGRKNRTAYLLSLMVKDERSRKGAKGNPKPSRSHALQCLAELAQEGDAQAAIKYAELTTQDADLARLRGLTVE